MEKIKLGQITAPVGIKGEIRVYPYLEQTRFSDIRKVIVGGSAADVEKIRTDKNMIVMKLSCCSDRNAAEALRGKELFLPEGETVDLGEDNYFIEQLEGCEVRTDDGKALGVLRSVISRPAQDLYEVEKPSGSSFLIPAVKEFILSVDTDAKVIIVRLPEGLEEL